MDRLQFPYGNGITIKMEEASRKTRSLSISNDDVNFYSTGTLVRTVVVSH